MKVETLNKLSSLFQEMHFLVGGPCSDVEIKIAQDVLGISFSNDYIDFIKTNGGAIIGAFPIFGLKHAEPMDDHLWSVVDVTIKFRNDQWPYASDWYIVSMDHSGNPIGINKDGIALSYDHDKKQLYKVANSFEDLLLSFLKQ